MFCRKWILLLVLAGILTGFATSSWTAPLESLMPKKGLPEGWTLAEGPQIYTRKTLFEHINGEAELFLKYGFQNSVFAVYQSEKNREDQIEIDLYDMGNVLQAFGIFSRFRNEESRGGFGLDSFLDDHSAFFYQGKYFVMLHAPEPNREILRQFSEVISLKMSDPSPPPKEIRYFPEDGLRPGSIQYFSEGLLGHQFLKRGFRATYVEKVEGKDKVEMKEFHFFLAIFRDPQQAMKALTVYKEDLSKKGKVSSGSIIEFQTKALKGEDPHQGKVMVLQKGFYLLGAVGFEKEEEVENRLGQFIKNVK